MGIRERKRMFWGTAIAWLLVGPASVLAENLHLIEGGDAGYAIYRSGKLDAADMTELCDLGITQMMVLSGNADEYERRFEAECPSLQVVFEEEQDEEVPVSASFLERFDQWVAVAKEEGTRIAFRCNCGCHRTGRLAAYYQMKYRGLTVDEAEELMMERGRWMLFFPGLKKQLRAMNDYIHGRPCSTRSRYCVRDG